MVHSFPSKMEQGSAPHTMEIVDQEQSGVHQMRTSSRAHLVEISEKNGMELVSSSFAFLPSNREVRPLSRIDLIPLPPHPAGDHDEHQPLSSLSSKPALLRLVTGSFSRPVEAKYYSAEDAWYGTKINQPNFSSERHLTAIGAIPNFYRMAPSRTDQTGNTIASVPHLYFIYLRRKRMFSSVKTV